MVNRRLYETGNALLSLPRTMLAHSQPSSKAGRFAYERKPGGAGKEQNNPALAAMLESVEMAGRRTHLNA